MVYFLQTPRTYQAFADLMIEIWEGECKGNDDGGMTMRVHDLYDEWHDARRVARALGMVNMAPTTMDGARAYVHRFPDGTGAVITRDGSAFREASPMRLRIEK
jgi:hypothetical protein